MAAEFGRLRKGAVNTTVAAVVVAALAASQAPGVTTDDAGRKVTTGTQPSADAPAEDSATGNSPYYTDLPPLNSPNPSPTPSTPVTPGASEAGIPATVLDAYKKAATALQESKPGCNLEWQLLAAIGKVESGQARGGRVDANGTTISPILGPQLNGNGFASISDTDDGAYDGDASYDRAVGPMQFIPSTWEWAGRDGNADGKKDPNNVYDAALAAGHYLCRFGWDLSTQGDLSSAILSYNNSQDYLNLVLRWLEYYRKGTHEIPDGTGTLPSDRSDDNAGASPSPSPTPPRTPSTPAKPGGNGGSTSPKPTPPSTTPPSTTPPSTTPPTPTDTVDHLEDAGTAKLTAMAGDTFTEKISARAETEAGKGVAKVRVRFTIIGQSDATFAGGEKYAAALTNSAGEAVAPALRAGDDTGEFVVRATLVGRSIPGLDYTATVTERAADTLARTSDTALTCTPGGEFADQVEVKATYKGAVADKVAATATLIKSADDPTENDKGPYFKDADGKAVRTLTGLTTDANGLLKLPKLYADDTTGTFLLRINTAGGATLTVELKVEAPAEATPTPTPSESESGSASASPTA
ncbi:MULTISPECIES: lytic transglycosylase domain-containing protein [unclassified Streptomyces]|uniref:lytic transglycosylase domain-containing protein n=1 Tax=unclassified Streptomyces TaxID=2593676 RepID=UPI0023656DB0|nr:MULTISPECIES: lytic transglycosylase domain-containing protein [unclassified Streptomyces]MDF3141513.1 lytic transglycosylase domain-containing protein [Streptomyces sp. T21Q-yed]WDF37340.1 lytic transglycosylase domain-containing protein [Streptomyces sp. T12]